MAVSFVTVGIVKGVLYLSVLMYFFPLSRFLLVCVIFGTDVHKIILKVYEFCAFRRNECLNLRHGNKFVSSVFNIHWGKILYRVSRINIMAFCKNLLREHRHICGLK